jgi:hypothetical protein
MRDPVGLNDELAEEFAEKLKELRDTHSDKE